MLYVVVTAITAINARLALLEREQDIRAMLVLPDVDAAQRVMEDGCSRVLML